MRLLQASTCSTPFTTATDWVAAASANLGRQAAALYANMLKDEGIAAYQAGATAAGNSLMESVGTQGQVAGGLALVASVVMLVMAIEDRNGYQIASRAEHGRGWYGGRRVHVVLPSLALSRYRRPSGGPGPPEVVAAIRRALRVPRARDAGEQLALDSAIPGTDCTGAATTPFEGEADIKPNDGHRNCALGVPEPGAGYLTSKCKQLP
ncbi:MAG: hypothetical protein ACREYA_01550 [Cupriavidus necator]